MSSKAVAVPKTLLDELFDRPPGLPATCSDGDLIDAVRKAMIGATDDEIADTLGVPISTVKHWIASKEWQNMKQQMLPVVKNLHHNQLFSIRSIVLEKLTERLRLGDPMYNNLGEPCTDEDGNQLYRPIKGRELSNILAQVNPVLHDLEVEIGVVADDRGTIELDDLAEALAELARKKRPQDISGESQRVS